MAYRLKPEADFRDTVQSVLAEQLQQAEHLLETAPNGLHDAIHAARKRLKRSRALYRLIAAAIPDLRQQENARLRDIARRLSTVRDAAALVETLGFLETHAESEGERQALSEAKTAFTARRERIAEATGDLADAAKRAAQGCREALAAFEAEADLPQRPAKSARIIAKGWKKTMKRAANALVQCREAPHSEAFHDLRKATQTYWMQLSLLRDLWPSALSAKRQTAKQLADCLGHEHDLSVLAGVLDAEAGLFADAETLSHLFGLIIRQQQALREDALTRAETLFADGPEPEASIIAALWLRAATD
ncbi:CHAD domain-containing protein [Rhizobium paknamense]|uniref:CHAD domain-containing protein n=1 Tax=Rhizobium paknamense TaxID=1206817 RepID=A0ABU0IDC0_9HYPH|nr:CHAD domain-containing protein [Rhizobium paknamense]MDQ0456220.1 CHAD domain-containing protein [Rhizobium paknamense]